MIHKNSSASLSSFFSRAAQIVSVLVVTLMFFNNTTAENQTLPLGPAVVEAGEVELGVWWPVKNATVEGVQPFKLMLEGRSVDQYNAYWQVDGGSLNRMGDNYEGYPHKEIDVDLSGWTWRGEGPYEVTFVAQTKNGEEIATETVPIRVESTTSSTEDREGAVRDNFDVEEVEETEVVEDTEPTDEVVAVDDAEDDDREAEVNVWWPVDGARVSGTQSFKADVPGRDAHDYEMTWQVGDGNRNAMSTDSASYPHKEAQVNLTNWNWRSDDTYQITFIAEDNGREIARETVEIHVNSDSSNQNESEREHIEVEVDRDETVETEQPEVNRGSSSNPIAGEDLYVAPNSSAERQANEWRHSRPSDAAMMDIMARESQAMWLGGWNRDIEGDVRARVNAAERTDTLPVFVAYNIPYRDCGLYSAGGANSAREYRDWIQGIADGLRGSKAVVIVEPDALAGADCLSPENRAERKELISEAIVTLKNAGATVYMESSTPPWKSTDEMAKRLREVGIENADGFALNTSSYTATNISVGYGEEISEKLGGMHFVVDTSRSGRGQTPDREWCNPPNRGLGERPTTNTGHELVDAFLWVKAPGESDGTCNGGPNAGQWWPEYALELVKNRAF